MTSRILKVALPVFVVAALLIGGYFYWQHEKRYPSTDDASIQAHVINIAPRVSGKVVAIYVHDQEHVTQGQKLFDLDPVPFQLTVDKAEANLDTTRQQIEAAGMAVESARAVVVQREAELKDTQAETKRALIMVQQKYFSRAQGDVAVKNLHVAEAALTAAKSELQETIQKRGEIGPNNAQWRTAQTALLQAKLNLHYTHLTAPTSGYVANFGLRQGDVISAYQPVFALIEDQYGWAEANFKETQLTHIKPGQSAVIKIDMYPGQSFTGTVSSISEGSGTSFSLLPPENASGNWVKVTQRFPVKVAITHFNPNYPLRLGASCTVTIDTLSHDH